MSTFSRVRAEAWCGTRLKKCDGSPMLALKCNFARYIFVDVPDVLATLRSRLAGHPKFAQISFIEGDCNAVIEQILIELPRNHLTLAFVDPTGLRSNSTQSGGLFMSARLIYS